jgi:hypothetical protein
MPGKQILGRNEALSNLPAIVSRDSHLPGEVIEDPRVWAMFADGAHL